MIIVAGSKRSGTSLMMQMLEEAGFIVLGEKFPKAWDKEIYKTNKNGFYESKFIDVGANNLNCPFNPNVNKMAAVKIFCHGLPKTDMAYIDKVILMIRNWREQEISNRKLNKIKKTKDKYPVGYDFFHEYASFLDDYGKRNYPTLIVNYNELIEDPKKHVADIKAFLGIGRWDLAEKIVNKKYHTIKDTKKLEDSNHGEFKAFLDIFHKKLSSGQIDGKFRELINGWKTEIYKDIERINKEHDNKKNKTKNIPKKKKKRK